MLLETTSASPMLVTVNAMYPELCVKISETVRSGRCRGTYVKVGATVNVGLGGGVDHPIVSVMVLK